MTDKDTIANDPRTQIETVNTSWTGIVITTVSASASILGSAVIIFLILRSQNSLRTVYHRILFAMSIFDLLQCIPMALTTVPMPKDMLYEQFDGWVYGNRTTCNIQGFTFTMGSVCASVYNAILCIYYLCAIRFRMKDEQFRKHIEPYLHLVSIVGGSLAALGAFRNQLLNPSPVKYTWCAPSTYPWWCDGDDQCLSGRFLVGFRLLFVAIIVVSVIVVVSLAMIVCHAFSQKRLLNSYKKDADNAVTPGDQQSLDDYQTDVHYTKMIVYQAILYTMAFLAVWHYPLILQPFQELYEDGIYKSCSATEISRLIFRPLQGFFNAIIFLYHKVRNHRRDDPGISLYGALQKIFDRTKDDPEPLLSNLALVERDSYLNRFAFDESHRDSADETPSPSEHLRLSSRHALPSPGNCDHTPDPSMAHSAQDLGGFSDSPAVMSNGGLSYGQTPVNGDICTLTSLGRVNHLLPDKQEAAVDRSGRAFRRKGRVYHLPDEQEIDIDQSGRATRRKTITLTSSFPVLSRSGLTRFRRFSM